MGIVVSDPLADLLTRLRNAVATNKPQILVPDSKLKWNLAQLLASEGYLGEVKRLKSRPAVIQISLEPKGSTPLKPLKGMRKISTPGRRVYIKSTEIKRVRQGLGIAVISTPQGLMSAHRAKARRLGGELICEVW